MIKSIKELSTADRARLRISSEAYFKNFLKMDTDSAVNRLFSIFIRPRQKTYSEALIRSLEDEKRLGYVSYDEQGLLEGFVISDLDEDDIAFILHFYVDETKLQSKDAKMIACLLMKVMCDELKKYGKTRVQTSIPTKEAILIDALESLRFDERETFFAGEAGYEKHI